MAGNRKQVELSSGFTPIRKKPSKADPQLSAELSTSTIVRSCTSCPGLPQNDSTSAHLLKWKETEGDDLYEKVKEKATMGEEVHDRKGGAKKRNSRLARSTEHRFLGVRQRPSGRWVAEIKDSSQKLRLWLGTFDTAVEAARAYDTAACVLRGRNTRTNFIPSSVSSVGAGLGLASKAARLLLLRHATGRSFSSSIDRLTNSSTEATFPGTSYGSEKGGGGLGFIHEGGFAQDFLNMRGKATGGETFSNFHHGTALQAASMVGGICQRQPLPSNTCRVSRSYIATGISSVSSSQVTSFINPNLSNAFDPSMHPIDTVVAGNVSNLPVAGVIFGGASSSAPATTKKLVKVPPSFNASLYSAPLCSVGPSPGSNTSYTSTSDILGDSELGFSSHSDSFLQQNVPLVVQYGDDQLLYSLLKHRTVCAPVA